MNSQVLRARPAGRPRPTEVLLLCLAVVLDVVLFSDAAVRAGPVAGGPRTSPLVIVFCAAVFLALLLVRWRARFTVLLFDLRRLRGCVSADSYRPVIVVCVALASVVAHPFAAVEGCRAGREHPDQHVLDVRRGPAASW